MLDDAIQIEVCPDCVVEMNRKGSRLVCPMCHINMPSSDYAAKNMEDRIDRGNRTGHHKPDADTQDMFKP